MRKCKGCKHFHIRMTPLRVGKDIYDFGLVECRKHEVVWDYASTQKLNRIESIYDDCKETQ